MLLHKFMDSPVGQLQLVASDAALIALLWENDSPRRVSLAASTQSDRHPVLITAEQQLREYFAGQRKTFSLPLEIKGTAFHQAVWQALLTIPFGETRSYGELARQLGRPTASRAVGAAIGRNPLSIVVPCHRVIGASGKLTGFAGGLSAKQTLLQLESQGS